MNTDTETISDADLETVLMDPKPFIGKPGITDCEPRHRHSFATSTYQGRPAIMCKNCGLSRYADVGKDTKCQNAT